MSPDGGVPVGEGSGLSSLWGYCGACERWRCSQGWTSSSGDDAACPECGSPPVLLERLEGGRAIIQLNLEVAVGPVGARSFLVD